MNRKPQSQMDARDQLISGLKRENKLQDQIIQHQKNTIQILEEQIFELEKLLRQFLDS